MYASPHYDLTGVIPASLSFAMSSSTLSTYMIRVEPNVTNRMIDYMRTFPPPTRFGGSVTLRVSSLGVRSTSRSAGVNFCMGFFFAFMMFGRDAYRGSFNLQPRITHVSSLVRTSSPLGQTPEYIVNCDTHRRSVVTTNGSRHLISSSPPSISLVTSATFAFGSTTTLLANVACAQSIKPASI